MKIRELLESNTKKAEAPKPRNFVAKNAIQSGAGAHKDKKKAAKQGDVKHKTKQYAESATAGATSAGNISVGAVYPNKTGKSAKNKDGTVKNALDMKGGNLMTGGSLVKRK
jgi:phage baseplate assembly protein gpV